ACLGSCRPGFLRAIRAAIKTRRFETVDLVVAEIPEALPADNPCYLKAMGTYQGSFIRAGDGDRRMTQYEILGLLASKGQPKEDLEPVEGTSVVHLDPHLIGAYLSRLRRNRLYRYAKLT